MIALGAVLVAAPLLVAVVMTVHEMGWRDAALLWGVSALATAMIAAGLSLIVSAVTP
ncbi:hypothetical protein HS041_12080 [Planomonospora sp. ID67723]|uniref:hypothetical protein n=1 Tax=Planomonospora sp. ID67723 TaxID=2738134 RepID=UPI0018C3BB2D|nr:hypothetical protein [Planomonospora sp. ID67723]MBG0828506.1 hypothetical protein [Planomonospora sp. ID67723]